MNYYNENDPGAVEWLKGLMAAGKIPNGTIDHRSIEDVRPEDLEGYEQAHFFCGIAGWSEALRLANWPADEAVWTGSCPCPPFSAAGNKRCPACDSKGLHFFIGDYSFIEEFGCQECGWRDDRNLWPQFYRLIRECRPGTIYGEQVASKTGLVWLAGIQADLERIGYRTASADLPAAGLASPNIRQRLWWVADSGASERRPGIEAVQESSATGDAGGPGAARGMADPNGSKLLGKSHAGEQSLDEQSEGIGWLADPKMPQRRGTAHKNDEGGRTEEIGGSSFAGGLGDTDNPQSPRQRMQRSEVLSESKTGDNSKAGFWSNFDLIPCTDDTQRRAQCGVFPMVNGLPRSLGYGKSTLRRLPLLAKAAKLLSGAKRNRIMRLRGYGNAINPHVAAEFIRAYMKVNERQATQD